MFYLFFINGIIPLFRSFLLVYPWKFVGYSEPEAAFEDSLRILMI
jgi:hypothetical protein